MSNPSHLSKHRNQCGMTMYGNRTRTVAQPMNPTEENEHPVCIKQRKEPSFADTFILAIIIIVIIIIIITIIELM